MQRSTTAWSSYGHFRTTQLATSAICFCLGVAVIGTAGHTLHIYKSQHLTNPWWLPLWPEHFDTHGTDALIASGVAVVVLNGAYIALSFIPKFNLATHPTATALLTFAITFPVALITLFGFTFAHVLNNQSPDIDTIHTWTCRFPNTKRAGSDLSVPSSSSNDLFEGICNESKFAVYGTLVILILQTLMFGAAFIGWVVEKWAQRTKGKEIHDTDNVEMVGGQVEEGKDTTRVSVYNAQ